MPRPCTVCMHPKRAEIDEALLNGTAIRDVAGQHDLRKSAVDRHRTHIGVALVAAKERKTELEEDHGDDLLAQSGAIDRELRIMFDEAKRAKSLHACLQVIDRIQKQTALRSQLQERAAQGGAGQRRYVIRWLDDDAPAQELPKPEPAALPDNTTTH